MDKPVNEVKKILENIIMNTKKEKDPKLIFINALCFDMLDLLKDIKE